MPSIDTEEATARAGEVPLAAGEKRKLSVNLTDEAAAVVRSIAEQKNLSTSEVLRRGIGLEKFIIDQLDSGATFLLRSRDGSVERVHFVFT